MMSYSIDKDKAYAASKAGIESIDKSRQADIEDAIAREIANSEKWHRRLPWFFKPINREQALDRIKSVGDGLASEYWVITKISYGRAYEAYKNIKSACENSSSPTIYIADKDFEYLRSHL